MNSDMNSLPGHFLNSLGLCVGAHWQYLKGPGHPAAAVQCRATCLDVSRSVWQSCSANSCHLGLSTHSVPSLGASAPSAAPT